jgi:phage/plasmid-like protein (TIGR03299 family)
MAHQLNKVRGRYSFATTERAWHGLGQVVDGRMTAAQVLKEANLNYEVQKIPLSYTGQDGILKNVPQHFGTIRTDTSEILGVVKKNYEVIQNKDCFNFFDAVVDAGEAIYETAGALGKGERVFLLAKLPDDLRVGGEVIDKYILLYNSHDGTTSIVAGMTSIRVVCNNTLQAALKEMTNKVRIAHTSSANERLKEASRVMGIASQYATSIQESFNRMTDVRMTEGEVRDYLKKVFTPEYLAKETEKEVSTRLSNMIEETLDFSYNHPTQQTLEAQGTLWGAYNAVSGYYNYIKTYRSQEEKFRSQYFGTAESKILKAFNFAEEIIH